MSTQDISTQSKIREIEFGILDQKYKQFIITHRPVDIAIPHLLKVFGHFYRDMNNTNLQNLPYLSRRTLMQQSLNGLGYAIRWLFQDQNHPRKLQLLQPSLRQLDEEAMQLLLWAMNYAKLVQDHVAWSKGMATVQVDATTKTITFEHSLNFGKTSMLTQAASEENYHNTFWAEVPVEELQRDFRAWLSRNTIRLQLGLSTWVIDRDGCSYKSVLEWLKDILWKDIPANTDLGGYRLDQFRSFYASLFLNSFYCALAEDRMDYRFGPTNEAGSLIFTKIESDMILWLSELSGEKKNVVSKMLEDLTFNVKDFHASLANYPFIKSKSGNIFLLGRLLSHIDPRKLLADVLNNRKRRIYESLIHQLEKANLKTVRSYLAKLKFSLIQEPNLSTGKSKITPDFIIFDKQRQEIMVLDYKHSLAPIGPSEVINQSKTLQEGKQGIQQVQKYVSFIKNNLTIVESIFGEKMETPSVYGVLLFFWPMAIALEAGTDVYIIDWFSLKTYLENHINPSLSVLAEWFDPRPDLSLDIEKFELIPEEIQVDDWKYRRMMLASTKIESS